MHWSHIKSIVAMALMSAACQSAQDEDSLEKASAPAVYGDDDRMDVYAYPDTDFAEKIRDAVVALVPKDRLFFNKDGTVGLNAPTLQESKNLCEGERYTQQPTASQCSGTLIDDRLIITAGHCFKRHECEDYYYVFNYYYKEDGVLETIKSSDVFTCNSLVAYAFNASPVDFAVIELDREATGRTPVEVRKNNTSFSIGDSVISAGFPSGLPAKIDDGGKVKSTGEYYFHATSDTFSGSSGSGIYDSQGTLVGVLKTGSVDYIAEPGSCALVKRYGEDENRGETISYANHALEVLCTKDIETDLCQSECGNAVCDGRETHETCPVDCRVGAEKYRGWFCSIASYDTGNGCHCSCGIPDPDCRKEDQTTYRCGSLHPQFCGDDGNCHLVQSPDSPIVDVLASGAESE